MHFMLDHNPMYRLNDAFLTNIMVYHLTLAWINGSSIHHIYSSITYLSFAVQRLSSIHRVIAGSRKDSLNTFFAFFFQFYKTIALGACLDC